MKRRLADAAMTDRATVVDARFSATVATLEGGAAREDLDTPLFEGARLSCRQALELFDAQMESRHADLAARVLKQRGDGFYTIGSAGHEGNAAVAAACRPSDPALLHYRSGAFFLARAHQVGMDSALGDILLGVTASADEPIAGGRHKVFGSLALNVPPQTSTIASHLPKAIGMAFALGRATRIGIPINTPSDAIIVCSFGDASANHSTATGAINAACWAAFQELPVPILFVCEDNGIGISVRTPRGWIARNYGARPDLRYFPANGLDLEETYAAARDAVDYVRHSKRPALLHLQLVRLLGHAGSDVESLYLSSDQIEENEARDPLIASARMLVSARATTPSAILARYEQIRERARLLSEQAARRPKLVSAQQVMASLAPREPREIAKDALAAADPALRAQFWDGKLPEDGAPIPLGVALNRALGDLLVRYPQLLIFGEDVAQKGGVYGITRDLVRRGKRGRVFDTLLDEQTVLGTAIGAAQLGCLPIAEIQYLAYVHNAIDQLRGEAATLQFFSQGQFRNPMVVRIAGYAYQKGFGGHFHNDNAVAALREIPGLIIASPGRPEDAVAMLRSCVAAANVSGSVSVFLEPIALYPVKDLHEKGDNLWCAPYPAGGPHVAIGEPRVHGDGRDLLIVSWANGLWMSLRVAKQLESERGISCRVMDLRWLAPLPIAELRREAAAVSRVLIVDETRRSGGVGEALIAVLIEGGFAGRIARVAAEDSFIPLGDAANLVLVQEADIAAAAEQLCQQ